MKLTVARDELLDKLSSIQNIVEKRNTKPILSHFLLDSRSESPFLVATDLETAVKAPVELQVEKGGLLCIPARKLFEVVKEVNDDITLESEDENWLRVKAGKSVFRLACLSPEEFPAWPEIAESEEVQIEAPTLLEMIEKTLYAAGENDTRYTLNGLLMHIQPEEKTVTVVGTDGHRMAVITKNLPTDVSEEKKLIIPRKAASELKRSLQGSDPVSIRIGKNHVLFVMPRAEFLVRLIEGSYPNYTQVIPQQNEKKYKFDRGDLTHSLRRVSIMSRERSSAVKAEFEGSILRLSSSNPDLGEASDELVTEHTDELLSVGFNARFLLEALSTMNTSGVIMALNDPLSPTMLTEDGSDEYCCVVMPMRV